MDSSVVGAVLTGEHLDMQRLAQNNEALSFDVKKILDNKSRIEGENFLLKKEIQRIRDQNQLLTVRRDGSKAPAVVSTVHNSHFHSPNQSVNNKHRNLEEESLSSRNAQSSKSNNFRLQLQKTPINKTVDYGASTAASNYQALPSIYQSVGNNHNSRSLNRDYSQSGYKSGKTHLGSVMEGGHGYTASNQYGRQTGPYGEGASSLQGVDDFRSQLVALKQQLDNERKGGIDLHTKLRESEHKRNEHLRKNQELLKRILELENEIRVLKQRFKEIMVKKASAILREQFQQLETAHQKTLHELKRYKEKDEKFLQRVETVKHILKTKNDKYREAMEGERVTMKNAIDNFKLLCAELRTENQEFKTQILDLRKQISIANYKSDNRQIDLMNDHVVELQQVVDEYKNKAIKAQVYATKVDSQVNELQIELQVTLKRASLAENELINLRQSNYQLEVNNNQLQVSLEESKQRQIEAQRKFETLYQDYQRQNHYQIPNLGNQNYNSSKNQSPDRRDYSRASDLMMNKHDMRELETHSNHNLSRLEDSIYNNEF